MTAIIIKDFWESLVLKKNLLQHILMMALLVFLIWFMPKNMLVMMLNIGLCIPTISSVPLQYSLEQDEISKFDEILITYPITKKNYSFQVCIMFDLFKYVLAFITCDYAYICICLSSNGYSNRTCVLVWWSIIIADILGI